MKVSAVLALALTSFAASQSINDVPACARTCITNAISSQTNCGAQDFGCICTTDNLNSIQSSATPCVRNSCGQDVALNQVLPAVQKVCSNQ
ncbi:hypothetical protein BJX99DRAFT_219584 [Aspergillus californicus]